MYGTTALVRSVNAWLNCEGAPNYDPQDNEWITVAVANFPLYLEGAAAYWHSAKDPPDHWEDIEPRAGEQGSARMVLKNAFLAVFRPAENRRYQEDKMNVRIQAEDEHLLA